MTTKPCPFCGCTEINVIEGSTFRWVLATCNDCGASSGEVRKDTLSLDRMVAEQEARKDAITEWNRRYEPR